MSVTISTPFPRRYMDFVLLVAEPNLCPAGYRLVLVLESTCSSFQLGLAAPSLLPALLALQYDS